MSPLQATEVEVQSGIIKEGFGSPFPPDDNYIAYRTADSAAGHNARLCLRILHEGGNVGSIAKVAVGLCIGCDGCCISVVVADSSDGNSFNS